MPSLRITKNGDHLCTVGSKGIWMFSVNAWADIWSTPPSSLNITGGTLHEDGRNDFLIWEMQHELKNGDRLQFAFVEGDESSRPPEIFDSEKAKEEVRKGPQPTGSWPPDEAEIQKMEQRPVLAPDLEWEFSMNGSSMASYRPGPGRQQLSFGLLWNNHHVERMRVSLSSTSLREVLARKSGVDHVTEYVPLGTRIELSVGA